MQTLVSRQYKETKYFSERKNRKFLMIKESIYKEDKEYKTKVSVSD